MAKFPIKRASELPPARASGVRANIDTDVAGGAVGKALQGLGGALTDIAVNELEARRRQRIAERKAQLKELERVQKIKEDTEYAQVMLKISSMYVIGRDVGRTQPTAEVAAEVHKETFGAIDKYINGIKDERVRAGVVLGDAKARPTWISTYSGDQLKKTTSNALATADANIQTAKAEGELGIFVDGWKAKVKLDPDVSQKDMDIAVKRFPVDSALEQIKSNVYSNNPLRVKLAIAELEVMKEKGMTSDQIKLRKNFLDLAKRETKANSDTVLKESRSVRLNSKDKTPAEKDALAKTWLSKLLADPSVTPAQYDIEEVKWNKFTKGEDIISDVKARGRGWQAVNRIRTGAIDKNEMDAVLARIRPKLSDDDFAPIQKAAASEIPKYQTRVAENAKTYAAKWITPRYGLMMDMIQASSVKGLTEEEIDARVDALLTGEKYQRDVKLYHVIESEIEKHLADNPDDPNLKKSLDDIISKYPVKTKQQIKDLQVFYHTNEPTGEPEEERTFAETTEQYNAVEKGKRYYFTNPATGQLEWKIK